MARTALRYPSEVDLVNQLAEWVACGAIAWLRPSLIREFDYASGRTDLLTLNVADQVVAFEAKLNNWRRAIDQAWRNTSFADKVFVVLPLECGRPAIQHQTMFEEVGVGLCLVSEDGMKVAIDSGQHQPVLPWLHRKARASLGENGNGPARGVGATDLC